MPTAIGSTSSPAPSILTCTTAHRIWPVSWRRWHRATMALTCIRQPLVCRRIQSAWGDEMAELQSTIEAAWEERESLTPKTKGATRKAVEQALALLDQGKRRVAEKRDGQW